VPNPQEDVLLFVLYGERLFWGNKGVLGPLQRFTLLPFFYAVSYF